MPRLIVKPTDPSRRLSAFEFWTSGHVWSLRSTHRCTPVHLLTTPGDFGPLRLPYVHVEKKLAGLRRLSRPPQLHDTVVTVGRQRLMVSGYVDSSLDRNMALGELAPDLIWRGEICVTYLGDAVSFLRRRKCNTDVVRKATIAYMGAHITAAALKKAPPTELTCV
ncbi:hypothetical protein PLICRDRAFT_176777 [Plicaturopsis crispa FD-325 SS-3]|nr:hypothetical protein PLICRDRAFT_176777 [Plicaturopsis crispa FD-325 SS-3]